MPDHTFPDNPAAIDYRVVAALSLLLSLWLIAIDPVLNRDAILYLRTADAYLQGGFAASQQLFERPALSICLALLHQLTGLPLVYAGLVLNSLFYALFCVTFVATVCTLGGDRRVQLFAAAVVLSHPTLNDQRSGIVRDPAYWACILLAFRQLLLYARQPGTGRLLAWYTCIALASVFRFEGLFYAALAPFCLLLTREVQRPLLHCLRLLAPTLLLLAVAGAVLVVHPDRLAQGGDSLPAIARYIDRLFAFPQQFGDLARASGEIMLEPFSQEDSAIAALGGFAAILALNVCRALTWPCLLLMLWRLPRLKPLRHDNRIVLRAHIGICLFYLSIFTLLNHFMSERYATQLAVFLLLYLPFALDEMWRAGRRSLPRYLTAGLLLLMTADTVHNLRYQKAFIRDAADWLVSHTPEQASVVSNDEYLAYFSRRQLDWQVATYTRFELEKILANEAYWRDKDFLVMRLKRHNQAAWQAFLQQQSLQETIVFDGGRHGKVAIVELNKARGDSDDIQP